MKTVIGVVIGILYSVVAILLVTLNPMPSILWFVGIALFVFGVMYCIAFLSTVDFHTVFGPNKELYAAVLEFSSGYPRPSQAQTGAGIAMIIVFVSSIFIFAL